MVGLVGDDRDVGGAQNGRTGTHRHVRLGIGQLMKTIDVTNVLKLNSGYLPGIAEIPASWKSEAAQPGHCIPRLRLPQPRRCETRM